MVIEKNDTTRNLSTIKKSDAQLVEVLCIPVLGNNIAVLINLMQGCSNNNQRIF